MRDRFLDQEYGEAWLKGFALMMKGIEKYGIRIPFTPAGPFASGTSRIPATSDANIATRTRDSIDQN